MENPYVSDDEDGYYDDNEITTRIASEEINTDIYSYDNHNYLIKATINNKSYTYSYDDAGNIINYNGKILKYNKNNELISMDLCQVFRHEKRDFLLKTI